MSMYTCTGCERPVAATANDPIHVTSRGKFCAQCLTTTRSAPDAPPEKTKPSRGEAQRARWAAMSPEEKTARTAHLRATKRSP